MTLEDRTVVLLPLYNEEATLPEVLHEIRSHFRGDIVVVDDGSTDGSPEVVQRLAPVLSGLSLLRREENRGYGRTLCDGFEYALREGYEAVVTLDADGQHPPSSLPLFLERLGEAEVAVVSGSRYMREMSENQYAPEERRRINRFLTEKINSLTSFRITDAFCGYKAIRCEFLRELALDDEGYAFPLQFWVQADLHSLSLEELPVPRLYPDLHRSFGEELDDHLNRLRFYLETLDRELIRAGRMGIPVGEWLEEFTRDR